MSSRSGKERGLRSSRTFLNLPLTHALRFVPLNKCQ